MLCVGCKICEEELEWAHKPGSVSLSKIKRVVIHLDHKSLCGSSNLPALNADNIKESLFDLAPSGVYLATNSYLLCGVLLPHPFTLTCINKIDHRRSTLCCTGRKLALPRRYLALCPVEPGLSSPLNTTQRLPCPLQPSIIRT